MTQYTQPVGTLIDELFEIVPQADEIKTLEKLVDNFGFYSDLAQQSLLAGALNRATKSKLSPKFATDDIFLRGAK